MISVFKDQSKLPVLTICVATYNRALLIQRLLKSISNDLRKYIEFVIVDDGSTDNTKHIIDKMISDDPTYNIRYSWQKNTGRAISLRRALLQSNGEYTIIMDSDDYFTKDGVENILYFIRQIEKIPYYKRPIAGAVFGVRQIFGNRENDNYPPQYGLSNFIAIRADKGAHGDLKEVVRTDLIKTNLYEVGEECRRVPTYLIWASIAEGYDCLCVPLIIAVKEYLAKGMTDQILLLKTSYAYPMVSLYKLLSHSKIYRSLTYRWRSRILWARYAHHAKVEIRMRSELWQAIVWIPGWLIYLVDRIKLIIMDKDK